MAKGKISLSLISFGVLLILSSIFLSSNGCNSFISRDITSKDSGSITIYQDNEITDGTDGAETKKDESGNSNMLIWIPAIVGIGTLILEIIKYLRPNDKKDSNK